MSHKDGKILRTGIKRNFGDGDKSKFRGRGRGIPRHRYSPNNKKVGCGGQSCLWLLYIDETVFGFPPKYYKLEWSIIGWLLIIVPTAVKPIQSIISPEHSSRKFILVDFSCELISSAEGSLTTPQVQMPVLRTVYRKERWWYFAYGTMQADPAIAPARRGVPVPAMSEVFQRRTSPQSPSCHET